MRQMLQRSEIYSAKAVERTREIDEGIKLATRVDELRQLIADLQANHEKLRESETKRFNAEIQLKQAERDELDREVSRLKKERERLLIPLNEEWKKVDLAKETMKELDVQYTARAAELDAKIAYLKSESQRQEIKERELANHQAAIVNDTKILSKKRLEIERRDTELKENEDYFTKESETERKRIKEELFQLAARENSVAMKMEFIRNEQKRIADKEANLISRYEVLESTLQELNIKNV